VRWPSVRQTSITTCLISTAYSPALLTQGQECVAHRVIPHGADQLYSWATCCMPCQVLLLLRLLLARGISRPLNCGEDYVGCLSYVAPHATC
jgi:hypothetical protein